ncbi:l-allo-threonine aldolase [Hyaloraphidium curvatum]|nr:l-allo-threonine aldolase [Hyaloraphidium curvatum]
MVRAEGPAVSHPLPTSRPLRCLLSVCEVDFRSDTTTYPTVEMFAAMQEATLGDDVFDDDESTKDFQKKVAGLFGKEAALLVLTGTMGNQVSVASHLSNFSPPFSVVTDSRAHIYRWEAGGVSYHTGATITPVPVPDGEWMSPALIQKNWWDPDSVDTHHAPCKLICVENTLDGVVFPRDKLQEVSDFARSRRIPLHMDGARLWNAAATGIATLREWADYVDSISLCFSKGLGTPMGTVVVGSEKFISKCRAFRKVFGGGWRQSGILASACDYALDNHFPALHLDHVAAQGLAARLKELGITILKPVETNMLFVDLDSAGIKDVAALVEWMKGKGIRLMGRGTSMRIVVHRQNNKRAGYLGDCFAEYLAKLGAR